MVAAPRLWWALAFGAAALVHLAATTAVVGPALGRSVPIETLVTLRRLLVAAGAAAVVVGVALSVRRGSAGWRVGLGASLAGLLLVAGTQYGCARNVAVTPAPVQERVEDGQAVFDHARFDQVLERFVDERGMVDYAALEADRAALDEYVGQLATASPRSNPELFPTREHQMAYWINAYNALMMHAVIESYPIKSVTDIMVAHGVFSRMHFTVGGDRMTLDDIEKGILLKEFDDAARAHFALTCASMGCPRLQRTAWRAQGLDARLDEAGRIFLRSRHGVQLDPERNTVRLSSYFKWYPNDFGPDHRAFVRPYLDEEMRRVLDGMDEPRIEHLSYDWRLNDANAAWSDE
jgi:hypothetical protein